MNSAWWFVAGLLTGWLVTCLAIGFSVTSTRINRWLRKLGLRPETQPQNQDQLKKQ